MHYQVDSHDSHSQWVFSRTRGGTHLGIVGIGNDRAFKGQDGLEVYTDGAITFPHYIICVGISAKNGNQIPIFNCDSHCKNGRLGINWESKKKGAKTMPMNRKLYPPDWDEISARLKEEVGQKCEECGAPAGEWVHHRLDNPKLWISALDEAGEEEWYGHHEQYTFKPVKIILTTAHLDQNPGNNDRSNLRVLCRGCHLRYDAPFHAVTARKTRLNKKQQAKLEAGQLLMFEEDAIGN